MPRFEQSGDGSSKFWSVEQSGNTLQISWGKVGSKGQTKEKQLNNTAQATSEAEKLIAQKHKKGYRQVEGYVEPAPLGVTNLVEPGKYHGLVLGLGIDKKRIAAVGGQGSDLLLLSATGKTFRKGKSPGPGLRSAFLEGDELWVCGEYGYVAKSLDLGKTWTKITTSSRSCLFGVTQDDRGDLWIAGDSGFLARSRDREMFRKVAGVKEYIGRISNSSLGVLVPTDAPGYLYICNGKKVERCGLKAGVDLMYATVTDAGTIIVVGLSGHIHRSTDCGKSFEQIKTPKKSMLTGIDCLPDGRVVVVGDGVILFSNDDGAHFTKLDHEAFGGVLWCCRAYRDGMIIGGERGTIMHLGT